MYLVQRTPLFGSITILLFIVSVLSNSHTITLSPPKFYTASILMCSRRFLDFNPRLGVLLNILYNTEDFILSNFLMVLSSASFLCKVGDNILVKTSSYSTSILFIVPPNLTLIALLNWVSISFVCALLHQTWASYSAVLHIRAITFIEGLYVLVVLSCVLHNL